MENFKEIAEKCLTGELSGTFVLKNGEKKYVNKKDQTIKKDYLDPYSPYIIGNRKYSRCGAILPISNEENPYDIVDFIPDQMVQTKIEIDIPEGKVPVMEQTENGVVITWKEKNVTYEEILESLRKNKKLIHYVTNDAINQVNDSFIKKINVIRKLTNIRNYFGEPDPKEVLSVGWCISANLSVTSAMPAGFGNVVFLKKEHAEQAIKMLGDELKYLFEPR